MRIYAGIDEAGYGPMFGPFVIGRCAFAVADDGESTDGWQAEGAAPPLWKVLSRAVCRSATDRRRRIAVADSKQLYNKTKGLRSLERGVLSFAHLAGCDVASLDDLLAAVAHDAAGRSPSLLWYADEDGGPPLPDALTEGELGIARSRLRRAATDAGVSLPSLAAAVIYEDRYNQIVSATRSKARCAWQFVGQHLLALWMAHGESHPFVVVDRQGGRKIYHELLQLVFEDAEIRLVDESDDISRYIIRHGRRAMTVSFEVEAEERHLPVALASMTAKYLRELLMQRFNRFWCDHCAQLKPTAGYRNDAQRFLADIEPTIEQLQVDRDELIRRL